MHSVVVVDYCFGRVFEYLCSVGKSLDWWPNVVLPSCCVSWCSDSHHWQLTTLKYVSAVSVSCLLVTVGSRLMVKTDLACGYFGVFLGLFRWSTTWNESQQEVLAVWKTVTAGWSKRGKLVQNSKKVLFEKQFFIKFERKRKYIGIW